MNIVLKYSGVTCYISWISYTPIHTTKIKWYL